MSIAETMQREGVAQYPNEACGFVTKVGKKTVCVVCDNSSSDPKNEFVISASDYAKTEDAGEIIGVWHTHPEKPAAASYEDIRGCNDSEIPWYILGVYKESDSIRFSDMIVIQPMGDDVPYIGRPYIPNVHDCYTLAQDYYKREFGLTLGSYENVEDWWLKGEDFLVKHYEKENFIPVFDEPIVGDAMLIQSNSRVANHVGIYIGDDVILHHSRSRLSKRDTYSGYWKDHTVVHLRHKTKC
jgi:proteasome lid subunit RPN8/RPN11